MSRKGEKGKVPRRLSPGRHRFRKILTCLVGVLLVVAVGCKVEEKIELRLDGSGVQVVKIIVPLPFASDEAMKKVEDQMASDGYTIAGKGLDASGGRFVTGEREFNDVSELSTNDSSYSFMRLHRGWLKRAYWFELEANSTLGSGVERYVTVEMPGPIDTTSLGTADGRRVSWDASGGGTLNVEGSGWFLPAWLKLTVLGLVAVLIAVWVILRKKAATSPVSTKFCMACGAKLGLDARFCTACGRGIDGGESNVQAEPVTG